MTNGEFFPSTAEYFYTHPKTSDGLRPDCRKCKRKQSWQWRADNPERRKASDKSWQAKNPDKVKGYHRAYIARNPEYPRERKQAYRARQKAAKATFTKEDWTAALAYFNGCCAYCGHTVGLFDRDEVLHQDHVIPVSKGGDYTPDSVVPACQSCNFRKNAKNLKAWLLEQYSKTKAKKIIKNIERYFSSIREDK
jgi:HNH endonuclease